MENEPGPSRQLGNDTEAQHNTESLQVQVDDGESTLIAHSNNSEHQIVEIPIIETTLNHANNHIAVTPVYHSPSKVQKLFDNK